MRQALRVGGTYGELPLHVAAKEASAGVVRALIEAMPETVRLTAGSDLPIHVAAHHAELPGRVAVVRTLLAADPDTASVAGKRGTPASLVRQRRTNDLVLRKYASLKQVEERLYAQCDELLGLLELASTHEGRARLRADDGEASLV